MVTSEITRSDTRPIAAEALRALLAESGPFVSVYLDVLPEAGDPARRWERARQELDAAAESVGIDAGLDAVSGVIARHRAVKGRRESSLGTS